MNRKYSNIKKIALSLLVVGLAISTQAFKNGGAKFATYKYGNINGDGVYQLVDPLANPMDNCGLTADDPCLLESDTQHTSPFTFATRPGDVTIVPGSSDAEFSE